MFRDVLFFNRFHLIFLLFFFFLSFLWFIHSFFLFYNFRSFICYSCFAFFLFSLFFSFSFFPRSLLSFFFFLPSLYLFSFRRLHYFSLHTFSFFFTVHSFVFLFYFYFFSLHFFFFLSFFIFLFPYFVCILVKCFTEIEEKRERRGHIPVVYLPTSSSQHTNIPHTRAPDCIKTLNLRTNVTLSSNCYLLPATNLPANPRYELRPQPICEVWQRDNNVNSLSRH